VVPLPVEAGLEDSRAAPSTMGTGLGGTGDSELLLVSSTEHPVTGSSAPMTSLWNNVATQALLGPSLCPKPTGEAPPQPPLDTTAVKEGEEGTGSHEGGTMQEGSHQPSLTTTSWSTGMSGKEQQRQQEHVNKWAPPNTRGSKGAAELVSGLAAGPVTRRRSKSPKVIADPADTRTAAEKKAENKQIAKDKRELVQYELKVAKLEALRVVREAQQKARNDAAMKEKDQARRESEARRKASGETAAPVVSYQMDWRAPDPLPSTGSASSSSSSSSSGASHEGGGDQGYVGLAPAREGSELFDLLAASRIRDDANNAAEDLAAARGESPNPSL